MRYDPSTVPPRAAYVLLALALFAGAGVAARRIQVAASEPYDVAFVPSAATLRWTSLGHALLAANLTWLRAVQYMGEPRADARGWGKLRALLDLVTDLDPRHGYAYQVGGNILAGVGRIDDSNEILEKGHRNVPDRYILPFQRAVNAFLYAGNYAEAGRWFEIASATSKAPAHLREYVVAMYVKGDAAEAALSFLQRLEAEAQDDESRKAVRSQIRRATFERDASALEAAIEIYRERHGAPPALFELLVADGLLFAIPPDPYGGSFYVDPEGRVRSTAFTQRFARPLSGRERGTALQAAGRRVKELEGSVR
jgi:tetratricopeptide (TPR) repeat protein